jgi:N-acetylneuraminic acid mutarotase
VIGSLFITSGSSKWTSVSTLPYIFYQGSAVVLNNEIHILGSCNNSTKHYKWNSSKWTSVSTLPYIFSSSSAVVLNNGIHILGGGEGDDQENYYLYADLYVKS